MFSKSGWKPIRSRAGLISAFDMKELPSRPVMLNHDDNRSLIQSHINIFKPIPESLKTGLEKPINPPQVSGEVPIEMFQGLHGFNRVYGNEASAAVQVMVPLSSRGRRGYHLH